MSAPPFRNWAGTAMSQPHAWVQPADEAELTALLQRAAQEGRHVKVVGAGHSWSDIACTDGYLVNLDRMARLVRVDRSRGPDQIYVTVQAGIRLHALIRALQAIKGVKGDNHDQDAGIKLILKAIEAPLREIVYNAGGAGCH